MLFINQLISKTILFAFIFILICPQFVAGQENKKLIDLGAELLFKVKSGSEYSSIKNELENYDFSLLGFELSDDNLKKAFWINIYNAFVLLQLKENESVYDQKSNFFKTQNILIAQNYFSLDDIEHKILRRNAAKLSFGYFKSIFTKNDLKKLMVENVDARIHFALNCGAASCPPIAYYDYNNLEEELNIAVISYFVNGLEIKDEIIYLPKFMSWFRGDFNGKKGMRQFLISQNLLDTNQTNYKIRFKDYDWTVKLDNFRGF
jgi:anaerobic ribonucleoside-triphosphate reductase